ncbi:acyltransferase family protein [Paraburkholderia tropica]|uniref:acyltransferase family protein n=1 Tax=Paraburkholderia tropica TaxID=92647 RepID=UPI002AB70DFA|nr:acyltransferase family protein [Paraburkholderia tropica]
MLAAGLIVARPQAAPFPACVLPVAGTAIVLGMLHGRRGGTANWLLTLRPVVYIGKISYSLYLWHWPVFVLFRWTVGLEGPVERVAALAITAILSVISYHLVEQPPRRFARGAKKPAMIAAGLLLIVSGYVVSSAVASNQPQISLSTVTRNMMLWYPSGCQPIQTTRDFAGGTELVYTRGGCNAPVTYTHSIFVLGDSHALAYVGMFRKMVVETGTTVHAYNVGGCPFISLQAHSPGRDEQCKAFGAASVADMLPQIKPGDIVLLASLRLPRMVDQWAASGLQGALDVMHSQEAADGRRDGVAEALPIPRTMTARSAHVVFEAPTPMLQSIPFRCADWFNRSNPICALGLSMPRAQLEAMRAPILASYKQMEQSVPGVSVWDPLPVICPSSECNAYRDGKPLLFDGDHISFYTNTLLLPSFQAYVETLNPSSGAPAPADSATVQ